MCRLCCLVVVVLIGGLPSIPSARAQIVAPHDADLDGSFSLSLNELLRIVQFFNQDGLHCAQPGEPSDDGFVPGPDPSQQSCAFHSADYRPADWQIRLTELLRVVQLFTVNGYFANCASEEGFATGMGADEPCSFVGDFTDPQPVTGQVILPPDSQIDPPSLAL